MIGFADVWAVRSGRTVLPRMDLRLFDGAAAGAAGSAGAAGDSGAAGDGGAAGESGAEGKAAAKRAARNPLAGVQYGTQAAEGKPDGAGGDAGGRKTPDTEATTGDAQKRAADFEQLIKGQYKDLFDGRVQQIIDGRFKQTKALEQQAQGAAPVMELLAAKYGVDAKDPQKVLAALEEDAGFYEDEAVRTGMTVEQLKSYKKMERENAQLRMASENRQKQEAQERVVAQWHTQAEQAKAVYADFDLRAEIEHPATGRDFLTLLQSNVPVRTAYEVVHKDEIISGAMQFAANTTREKVIGDIRARGMRPDENGAGGAAPANVKTDVSKLTRADREEIERRVARGERITF